MGLFTIGPPSTVEEKPNYEKDRQIYEILQKYQASTSTNCNNNKNSKIKDCNSFEEEYVFDEIKQTWNQR